METSKSNILLIGSSGAGKSTLINSIFDCSVAATGNFGGGKTQTLMIYTNEILNYTVIDTKGLELGRSAQKNTLKQVDAYIKGIIKEGNTDAALDVIWYCVDSQGKRFFKENVDQIIRINKSFPNVPVIIVLTKAYSCFDDRIRNESDIKKALETYDTRKKIQLRNIISVNSVPFRTANNDLIPIFGIDELINSTNQIMPEAKKTSETNMIIGKKKAINKQANITVAVCTTGAAVIGFVPIPIADAPVLTMIQTAMIKGIAFLYAIDSSDSSLIITAVFDASVISSAAKMTLSALKAIPGINIGAVVLNAFMAGIVTAAIGESSIVICEKISTGEISLNDIDKMKLIVTEKLKSVIETLIPKLQTELKDINVNELSAEDVKNIISSVLSSFMKK